jgi:2-aminoethylphosphonate-pyruvate transaminase
MTARPRTAVILAAGEGRRLAGMWSRPKGLLRFGRETLIERSLRLLKARGMERVVLVAGHQAEAYRDLPGGRVEIVLNADFATTGSMASLAKALAVVKDDFLLLESDLAYEARGLDALLERDTDDAVLASGPTGATDEVWVDAPDGRVRALSKEAPPGARHGEFVGLSRVSAPLAVLMMEAFHRFVNAEGHARMSYDSEALPLAAAVRPVSMILVQDLLWGEVDDAFHYARMRDRVWPALDEPENA